MASGDEPQSQLIAHGGQGHDKVKYVTAAEVAQFPVENISWNDAQHFLEKLNEKERGSGYWHRLPTEAEWEYACRGAPSSEEECAYHFYLGKPVNALSSTQANFSGNYPAGNAAKGRFLGCPTKVGSYTPNQLGLYDMHGNVWEWVQDVIEPGASAHVIRGGCWCIWGQYCRAAQRLGNAPSNRGSSGGFRLARVPSSR